MERQEPLGYEGVHAEKKFPILPDARNIIIECTVNHDGRAQEVLNLKRLQ